MDDEERSSTTAGAKKDPTTIARKYQLDLCEKAMEENVIVYLGTGCGKTLIAVLLMYELGHLIRKPSSNICVFLAPTVPLVRQQTMVIESLTDFKVQYYVGNRRHWDHNEWNKEIEQIEVLVMTPQILLHNLRHCFIRMELIALLIFDECHHAQVQTRHPYAQIMKEFYKTNTTKYPRIFGMTASPIIGKGGSNQLNYTKCINSLENLLDAKVYSVEDNLELESVIASPDVKFYFYGPVDHSESTLISSYCKKLDLLKHQCTCLLRENISDSIERSKKLKSLWQMHDNLIFCLENMGLYGAIQALKILSNSEESQHPQRNKDECGDHDNLTDKFLEKAALILNFGICDDESSSDLLSLDAFEEPFCSQKVSLLIDVLSSCYRLKENTKCIIFVQRIIVARALACILKSLKCLDFWKCDFLVGFRSGLRNMSRSKMNAIVEKFSSGEVNLLVATNVAEEGLDIQTCCLVVRFDLPQTVASFIQSRGRARMQKSEFIFLLERGNMQDEKLLGDFMSGEDVMNKEVVCRSSDATFDVLDEEIYKVDRTGASMSTACSVSLLHRYCAKLPKDKYFTPTPKFFYIDHKDGTICRLLLPANAPFRQVDSLPCASKDEAKRAACLNTCIELHKRGALSDFLLPGFCAKKNNESSTRPSESATNEDESLKQELYEMLVPFVLKGPLPDFEEKITLYFYYIRFIPTPDDRKYHAFGLVLKAPLPEEAEAMEVDLHLARGRIVKSGFVNWGMVTFGKEEISLAQNFQEMFLKIILDRSEYFNDTVTLGKNNGSLSSTFYLLLPIMDQRYGENRAVDWTTVKRCLSSPAFVRHVSHESGLMGGDTLKLYSGQENVSDILNSLMFVPHKQLFYFVDSLLPEINANSLMGSGVTSYIEHYKSKVGVQLLYPEQPLLKAKPLFCLRNLLHNRIQDNTEVRDLEEFFEKLPPELCSLKIVGFSKDIGSSLSLLPSLMHRLENLLVAIELKEVLSASFSEASGIRANIILEALTTERCMERFSLERYEVLGDAFLKYVVGRHSFLSFEGLDEGQLTDMRSDLVNNSNLCELAIQSNLQVYIRDESFEPSQYFPLGRPCTNICNADTESTVHSLNMEDRTGIMEVKCTKSHRWLSRKTIADAVEALIGAFLVESGFKAAIAFLQMIGIQGDFKASDVYRVLEISKINTSVNEIVNITELEESLGYRFNYRGLLLQAFIHPSYSKHSGGCYQKLEFLGDAVLEYLMTSYLYSVYPDLKPGQITDLRSIAVNNNSFAYIAVRWGFQKYLIKDSKSLADAVNKFEKLVRASNLHKILHDETNCPKVLGDLVESYIGAMLLDTGFNLREVWKVMVALLEPLLSFNCLSINSVRELRELCQHKNFCLRQPEPVKEGGCYLVKVEVDIGDEHLTFSAINHNSKAGRRMAAQEALAKLKDLGYRHKRKSLEEILRSTHKREPGLIGFNEDPLDTRNFDPHMFPEEKIVVEETNATPFRLDRQNAAASFQYNNNNSALEEQPSLSASKPEAMIRETRSRNISELEKDFRQCFGIKMVTESDDQENRDGIRSKKTAKSRLLEICAANYWRPPLFKCCKEEGPCHLRKFTFKVSIKIEGATCTVLECYSESRPRKRAAEEQAAQGALWCLERLRYNSNF